MLTVQKQAILFSMASRKEDVSFDPSACSLVSLLRDNSNQLSYVVLGYSDVNTLTVLASGSGSLDELVPNVLDTFVDKEIRFGIIKLDHRIDNSVTKKFVYLEFVDEGVVPTKKSLVAIHKHQVRKFLSPFHVDIVGNEKNDFTVNAILKKISEVSGTAVHEISEQRAHELGIKAPIGRAAQPLKNEGKPITSEVVNVPVANRVLALKDEAAFHAAIAALRNDADATNWVLIGYSDLVTLELNGTGSGGIEELRGALNPSSIQYGLFRASEMFDKTVRVFFNFFKLIGSSAPVKLRSQISTHSGFIQSLFQPYHVSFDLDCVDDLSQQIVSLKLTQLIGTADTSGANTQQPKSAIQKKVGPAVVSNATSVQTSILIVDEIEFKSALHALHHEDASTAWLIASYVNSNTIKLICKGPETDVSVMVSDFESDKMNYGLLRVVDLVDDHKTVKFVLILNQPENLPPLQRAKIGTQNGVISELFRPYHVNFFTSNAIAEITQATVMNKVQSASGSKSHVKS